MFTVLNKISKLKLSIDVQLELFDRLVILVLLHGCEIWECGKIVEGLQLKFLKYILGIKRSMPTFMVCGETGAFLIEILDKC